MGMGDVKLMGALGLFFGMKNIIMISILSFLIGAIASIFLLVFKIKKTRRIYTFWTIYSYFRRLLVLMLPEDVLFTSLWFVFSGE